MLTIFLIFLCEVSPKARRALWRWWYDRWARKVGAGEWTFMNYGLDWPPGERPPALQIEDEADRYCAQLYLRVAAPGAMTGKEVLEVGSGRGGGAAFLTRYLEPARFTGVDFSAEAVAFCASRHHLGSLLFKQGDAEALPFPDNSFDVVLNVESSHCYGSISKFFAEVTRVLRPGGMFLYADLREPPEMKTLDSQLAALPGMKVMETEDLTPFVAASLTADHGRKEKMIADLIPVNQRAMFLEFAGMKDSKIHRSLTSRQLLYHRWVLQKADPS
ncbi:MAG: Phthiotriol/phenolphthiotriol dimycocerosates methyltransferase [Verrucomicrobiales bacterium]|nr:Phthiotriol/phenolphthiotriol dimycocerosates methyltransferase [Verrucomicrobiales bacterium]